MLLFNVGFVAVVAVVINLLLLNDAFFTSVFGVIVVIDLVVMVDVCLAMTEDKGSGFFFSFVF